MAAQIKTLKDIGIYFAMVLIIVLILAISNYLLDYILTYEAAVRFNTPVDSLIGYITFFLVFRMIVIMPVVWLFVEVFNGRYKNKPVLKIIFIVISASIIALGLQSEMSASRATEDIKRLITYPVAGLTAYYIFNKCFYKEID